MEIVRCLEVARQLGRTGGRKRQMTESKIKSAKKLLASGVPARDVASNLGVSVPTCAKTFAKNEVRIAPISADFAHYGRSSDSSTASSRLCSREQHRQNLDSQVDALQKAGCSKIFSDKMTGSRMHRPGWDQLMDYVRPGDARVVTELRRMTRSLLHLLETTQLLERKTVHLVSLRENIDTSTATGRCFLSMVGAIHQMERELRAERAAAGRTSAKARGKTGGRPRTDAVKLKDAKVLYENSDKTAQEVCRVFGVGRQIFFEYLAQHRELSPAQASC